MTEDKAEKMPGVKLLEGLISKGKTTKDKVATLNGTYGETISDAVENHNLHAGAFKTVAKLQRMDPVKLNAWLTHFDDYRDKLKIDDLAAVDLPKQEMTAEEKAAWDAAEAAKGGAGSGQPLDG